MTYKEQIIIDGIDVSKCDRLIVNQLYGYTCNCEEYTHIISSCKNRPNCYFKQLARKTQECEELKEENQQLRMHFCNDCGEKDDYNIPCKIIRDLDYELQKEIEENNLYHKARDEIKKVCLEDTYTFADGTQVRYDTLDDILDIINKAKGG